MKNIKIFSFILLSSIFYANSNLQAGLLDRFKAWRGKKAEESSTKAKIIAERLGRKAAMTTDPKKSEKLFKKAQGEFEKQKKYQEKAIKLGREFISEEILPSVPTQEEIQKKYQRTSIALQQKPKVEKHWWQKFHPIKTFKKWNTERKKVNQETQERMGERKEGVKKEKVAQVKELAKTILGQEIKGSFYAKEKDILNKQISKSREAMIEAAKANDAEKFEATQKEYLKFFDQGRRMSIRDRAQSTIEGIQKGEYKKPISDIKQGFKEDILVTQEQIKEEKEKIQQLWKNIEKKQPQVGEPEGFKTEISIKEQEVQKPAAQIPRKKTPGQPPVAPKKSLKEELTEQRRSLRVVKPIEPKEIQEQEAAAPAA
ncbi:MAG: hypothetical protein WC436_02435 [Candidatus Babeliales bacterium]